MRRLFSIVVSLVGLWATWSGATEILHSVDSPRSFFEYSFFAELDDDVYSGDLIASGMFAPCDCFGIYADVSYRLLGYSYEYSKEGYVHNYANLHIRGFNETYAGFKMMANSNFGVDVGWRFLPGGGSQKNRFQRLNVEPFGMFPISDRLRLGMSLRYNTFLERKNYKPGDEVGLKASFIWRPFVEKTHVTPAGTREKIGWTFTETFLFQARVQQSENLNMKAGYRKMDDQYVGYKMRFEALRYFDFMKVPFGIGLNYEIHQGTLFGFETGHRIGFVLRAN